MAKQGHFKGNLSANFHNQSSRINFDLPALAFEEENVHFIYSPALDLTGYGKTEEEAQQSFKEALDQFFDYTTNKKTFEQELRRLGWKIQKNRSKAPSLVDMINQNDYLKEIFEEKQYRKFNQTVSMPAFA
jgi:predicted ribosome quality control (RQC) complex YloA/Tae2 family protein